MPALKNIKDRIRDALANGAVMHHDLLPLVFPPDQFPRAHNYQSNGGPPGCAMALGVAVRRMRGEVDWWMDKQGRRFYFLNGGKPCRK